MKRTIAFPILCAFLLLAGMTHRVLAQVYDKTYAKTLTLGGGPNGIDLTNAVTMTATSLLGNETLTLPSANGAGVLNNTGLGILSWVPISLSNFLANTSISFLTTSNTGSVGWLAMPIISTLTGNGISTALGINLSNANTWIGNPTILESIGTTSTDGVVLSNTQSTSVLATQQYSPRLRWSGQGWSSGGAGASEEVDWIAQTIPVSGSSNPTSYLDFQDQVNGGGYMSDFDLFSSGGGTIGISSPSDPTAGVLNVGSGIQIKGTATSGTILEGNGHVFTSSAALFPSAGSAQNILRSNGSSFASVAVNTGQFQPSNPTGTQSTSGVMMGLGSTASITPNGSGIVLIIVSGSIVNTAGSSGGPYNSSKVQIQYGTGTAPSNAASITSLDTAIGNPFTQQSHNNTNTEAFTLSAIASGWKVGTAYWVDLSLTDVSDPSPTGPVNISNVSISIVEL